MKQLSLIFCLFYSLLSFSQEWRDSLNVARDSYKKQDYSKALRYYQSAQKKAPDNINLSNEMGQSAYKAKEFEKAEKIYQQNSNSKNDRTAKANTFHNLGNSRMQKKDYQGAIDSYKESLRNNPSDNETRYNLSEAIRQLKKQQKKEDPKNNESKNQPNKNQNKDQNQNKPQPQNQQNQKKEENKSGGDKNSKLPNKSVERMLDKLTKAEAETKRKMGGSRQEGNSTSTGKDW